jgi:hypothetical protein
VGVGINVGFMRTVLDDGEGNILVNELGQEAAPEHRAGAGAAAFKIAEGNAQVHPPFQPVDLEPGELAAVRKATERIERVFGLDHMPRGLQELHVRARGVLEGAAEAPD